MSPQSGRDERASGVVSSRSRGWLELWAKRGMPVCFSLAEKDDISLVWLSQSSSSSGGGGSVVYGDVVYQDLNSSSVLLHHPRAGLGGQGLNQLYISTHNRTSSSCV